MNLIPRLEAQKLTTSVWLEHTPDEHKFELIDGQALWGGEERDRLLMALIYNVGFKHLLTILPLESRLILHRIGQEGTFLDTQERRLYDRQEKAALDIATNLTAAKAEGKGISIMAQDSICKYLEVRLGVKSLALQEFIRTINDLDTLSRITNQIFIGTPLEEVTDLIQSEITK